MDQTTKLVDSIERLARLADELEETRDDHDH